MILFNNNMNKILNICFHRIPSTLRILLQLQLYYVKNFYYEQIHTI